MHPRGEALDAVNESGFSDRWRPFHDQASAEVVSSWIRRLYHHHMVPCELWDAQSPARRPHRRVWSLGCEVELHVRRGGRERSRQRRNGHDVR